MKSRSLTTISLVFAVEVLRIKGAKDVGKRVTTFSFFGAAEELESSSAPAR